MFFTKSLPPEIGSSWFLDHDFSVFFASYESSYQLIQLLLKILDIDFWPYEKFGPKIGPQNLAIWAPNLNYRSIPRNYVSFRRVISIEKPSWTPFPNWAWVYDQLIIISQKLHIISKILKSLTLPWRRSISYRNQSIDLLSKSR